MSKTIQGFHAHVYFDASTLDSVTDLRARMLDAFGDRVIISTLRDRPIGPHPLPMFEVQISLEQFHSAVGWLLFYHGEHSVLIHPLTGNDLKDHTEDPLWLGPPLPLNLSALA